MTLNNHDSNFKELMLNRTFLDGFLETYLPKALLSQLDWESIDLYKMGGEHTEGKTQQIFEADVIYLARFKKKPNLIWIHFFLKKNLLKLFSNVCQKMRD